MVMLPLDKLNGWLFGISAARVRDPARRQLLIQYQRECFDVLAQHFRAAPGPATQLQVDNKGLQGVALHDQVASAMGLGHAVAGLVQQLVTMAVLRGSDECKPQRWLLSLQPGTPPRVQPLSAQTLVVHPDDLPQQVLRIPLSAKQAAALATNAAIRMHSECQDLKKSARVKALTRQIHQLPAHQLAEIAAGAYLHLAVQSATPATPAEEPA